MKSKVLEHYYIWWKFCVREFCF